MLMLSYYYLLTASCLDYMRLVNGGVGSRHSPR